MIGEAKLLQMRKIAERSTGTCRIDWSPTDALSLLNSYEVISCDVNSEVVKKTEELVHEWKKYVEKCESDVRFAQERLAQQEKMAAAIQDLNLAERQIVNAAVAWYRWESGEGELSDVGVVRENLKDTIKKYEDASRLESPII